ncbi:MAG: 30S ribosomal protein S18 [Elusimicrobiaceae bacterium]|jgi:small subunit ribosomal protein S18
MTEETSKPESTPSPTTGSTVGPKGKRPFKRREIRRKVCRLCADKIDSIDYKNTQYLRNFVMESGKILSRRITGTCAKHQRQICTAVKRDRNLALLPYTTRVK